MTARLECEHFVSIRPVSPGNWSPNGRQVAFVWADRVGNNYLWSCDIDPMHQGHFATGWPRRAHTQSVWIESTDGTDRRDVSGGPQWAPDGSSLVFLSRSSFNGRDQASLWTVAASGIEDAVEITHHVGSDRTPRWSPDGRSIAFVAHNNGRDDIHIVSAQGGRSLQLTYDRWDNTDLEWSPDGRWIIFISQRSDKDLFANVLCRVPAGGGPVEELTSGETFNDRSPRCSPDGRFIAFVSNRSGNDDLWCLDARNQNLSRLTDAGGDKGDPRWSPDGRWIAYSHFEQGDVNLYIIPASGGQPRRVVAGGVNDAPRWSPDGHYLLYRHAGPGNPPDLWIKPAHVDLDSPGYPITHTHLGLLEGMHFHTPVVRRYTSRDGTEVEGLLYLPSEGHPAPAPAILWLHGGPNALHNNGWHPLLQYLVQRGYAVFAPNYRGSTGYGKAFMEANTGSGLGVDLLDWMGAAELLRELPQVDRHRIGVMGRSAGGYAVLLLLGQAPGMFRAGVSISAPTNWLSYWEHTRLPWTQRLRMKLLGLPSTQSERYVERSPITDVERFQDPVLIVHGKDDPGVPCGQAVEMAAALESCGKSFECCLYPDEGHVFNGVESIMDSTRRIETFLSTYMA